MGAEKRDFPETKTTLLSAFFSYFSRNTEMNFFDFIKKNGLRAVKKAPTTF